jgi:transposase-like protein
MKGRKNHKYTYEDKLNVVRTYEEGFGYKIVSQKTGIPEHRVKVWLRRYRELGLLGLDKLSHSRVSPELKAGIVSEIKEKFLSLQSASIIYGVSPSALRQWKEDLTVCKAGLASQPMGRPKKKPPQTELEKLQLENNELKAELAYLKKVRALVEQREKSVQKIVPKPSTN